MSRVLILALAIGALAACDVDPASFPKHVLRDGPTTGTRIAGTDNPDVLSTSDTHDFSQLQSRQLAPASLGK